MKRSFSAIKRMLIALLLLFPILVWGNEKPTPARLMEKIDSLELIFQYDEACRLTDDFIAEFSHSGDTPPDLLSQAYLTKVLCLRDEGKNLECIPLHDEALRLALLTTDSLLISNCYREMGYTYAMSGNYQKSLDSYTTALEISSRMDDLPSIAIDLNAIGKIYEMWRQYDKALDFFTQSLEIARNTNNLNQVALRKASIASIYKSKGQFELALDWLDKSLKLEIQLGNEVRKGYRLDQMGEIYTFLGQLEKAEEYLLNALEIFRNNKVLTSESIALNHLAVNFQKKNNPERAISYFMQSLELANKTTFDNMKQKNHRELSAIFEQTGNFEAALNHYKKYVELKDTAYNETARQQLLDFQVKYETEQKEKELAVLNQQKLEQELQLNQVRQQRILMAGISIILLISLTALYGRFRIKRLAQARLAVANEQLTLLNQTKNKFFTILAHDLKNPIYAFRNIAAAVYDNRHDISDQDLTYYTLELKNSSTKLCSFLDELLKWAASLTGRIKPEKETIVIKPVLEELIELHRTMADNKNIRISAIINEQHTCYADQNMIQTIFRNLISNAIKFTPENGSITINSTTDDGFLKVYITDTGIGMTEEDTQKLFQLDQDPSKIHNSKEKGMGMGLILCKEFVDKNNGKLSAASQAGKGSTFTVTLPIHSNN
jgi:signal transduction histidine kinase